MAQKKITLNVLSEKSISDAIKEIRKYQSDLQRKTEILAERLAQIGVGIAEVKIVQFDAIYTSELLASIDYEVGAVIQNGARFLVYTNCPWASFVEFGTGIEGSWQPHDQAFIVGWKYDINNHGEKGWYYFRDNEWHWTRGMPSRPFMYETALELHERVTKVAREVFA